MDPPRAKPKRLNKALLSDIASSAAEQQMTSADRANNVAGLYMLDKRFNGKVLRHLEKCDSAEMSGTVASLYGRNKKPHLKLDSMLFTAVLKHSGLAIPTVELDWGFCDLSKLKLTGVESLKLVCLDSPSAPWRQHRDDLVRIISENKSSLKALLDVPQMLFNRFPRGLVLDEFSIRNVKPRVVKVPALNTNVFKYDISYNMRIPLAFMRTVNAKEIHLKIDRILPGSSVKPFGAKTANKRIKKLRVELVDGCMRGLDFVRIFREVSVLCPNLERFELVHEKRFKDNEFELDSDFPKYMQFTHAVDELVAGFERAYKEADTAPYKVHLKAHVWYASEKKLMPEEDDFASYMFQTDLPTSEEVEAGKQHSYFFRELSTGGKNLRVDCEIAEGTESESSDTDYYDSEDYFADENAYSSDDNIRSCDSGSL